MMKKYTHMVNAVNFRAMPRNTRNMVPKNGDFLSFQRISKAKYAKYGLILCMFTLAWVMNLTASLLRTGAVINDLITYRLTEI